MSISNPRSSNQGTASLNFGAFPGASETSVAVTGQTDITANAFISVFVAPAATADHTADEHFVETLKVFAGDIVNGTGFTIYGVNTSQLNEPVVRQAPGGPFVGGRGTLLYGTFNIGWSWA